MKICLAVGTWICLMQKMVPDPGGDDRARVDPDDPQRHDQNRERYPVTEQLPSRELVDATQDESQLQTHENEDEAV